MSTANVLRQSPLNRSSDCFSQLFGARRTLRVLVTRKWSRYQKHSIFFEKFENFQKKGLGWVCAPIWHISTFWLQVQWWKTVKFRVSVQHFKMCLEGANTRPKHFLGLFGDFPCIRSHFLAIHAVCKKSKIWSYLGPSSHKSCICRNFYPHFGAGGHVPGVRT